MDLNNNICRRDCGRLVARALLAAPLICMGLTAPASAAITVQQSGTTLTILGDPDMGDMITLRQAGVDRIQVDGQGFFFGVANIKIDTRGGGSDTIRTINTVGLVLAGNLLIQTRDGTTSIRLPELKLGGSLGIKSGGQGAGNFIQLNGSDIRGKTSIEAGPGDHQIRLEDLAAPSIFIGDVSIRTAAGGDGILVLDSTLLGGLAIESGSGDDVVTIRDSEVLKTVKVLTSFGDDITVLSELSVPNGDVCVDLGDDGGRADLVGGAYGRNLKILGGDLDDTVTVGQGLSVLGTLTIQTFAGEDQVQASDNVEVGVDLVIQTGDGHDLVFLLNGGTGPDFRFNVVRDVKVDTGKGDDAVILDSIDGTLLIGGDLSIKTADGIDAITLRDFLLAGKLIFDTGNQDDRCTIQDAILLGPVNAKLGNHDDLLILSGLLFFSNSIVFDGGGGTDNVALAPDPVEFFFDNAQFKSFEN